MYAHALKRREDKTDEFPFNLKITALNKGQLVIDGFYGLKWRVDEEIDGGVILRRESDIGNPVYFTALESKCRIPFIPVKE